MAWLLPGDKPLSEPMMVSLLTNVSATRSQWVDDYEFSQSKATDWNENVLFIENSLSIIPRLTHWSRSHCIITTMSQMTQTYGTRWDHGACMLWYQQHNNHEPNDPELRSKMSPWCSSAMVPTTLEVIPRYLVGQFVRQHIGIRMQLET